MKRLLITGLLTLTAIGTASADYATDYKYDLLHSGTWKYNNEQMTQSEDMTRLPPTAAGREEQKPNREQFRNSMQDHPSERPSGL